MTLGGMPVPWASLQDEARGIRLRYVLDHLGESPVADHRLPLGPHGGRDEVGRVHRVP